MTRYNHFQFGTFSIGDILYLWQVIPPFHEESDYFSARAIPSKSGILYQDETSEAEVATSRHAVAQVH